MMKNQVIKMWNWLAYLNSVLQVEFLYLFKGKLVFL